MIGDMHCHTTMSDGSTSPEMLVQYAIDAGLDFIAVTDHDTMGTTVVMIHADGYKTTSSSLAAEVSVSVGQFVEAGMTIGTVGNTALLETALGEHLHFAVTCNGKPVDPEDFLALGQL